MPTESYPRQSKNKAPVKKVLVVDYAGYDSIGEMPYLFSNAGAHVSVMCHKTSWLLKNSFYDTVVLFSDPALLECAREIIQHVQEIPYDWIIIGDDEMLRALNLLIQDEDLFKKLLPLTSSKNRNMIGSKSGLSVLCTLYGLTTPAYAVVSTPKEISTAVHDIGFPILIKVNESSGGSGVFFCANEHEVIAQFSILSPEQKKDTLLQKYIDGDIISVEALYHNGHLRAYAYSRVTRVVYRRFGISSERVYSECPSIEQELVPIGAALGLHGCMTMTFIRETATGIHFLIETDLRPQVWFRLASYVGVLFHEAFRDFLQDKDTLYRPKIENRLHQRVIWNFSREIIRAGLERKPLELLKWLVGWRGRWRYIPWYDCVLLKATCRQLAVLYVHGIRKAMHSFSEQIRKVVPQGILK